MERNKEFFRKKSGKKPRHLKVIKQSKYEFSEAIHSNKKYWNTVFHELDTSVESPTKEQQSKNLSEILPSGLYERVCKTLDIPVYAEQIPADSQEPTVYAPRRMLKEPLLSYRKALTIDRSLDSDTDVELSPRVEIAEATNIHQEFLRRPEREQVTWATRFLEPEREEEKNLVRRADDLTNRITQEFCKYMRELGGDQQSELFTTKAVKELFQVEFDTHVARSLRIVSKELPTIQEKVANITGNPEKSCYAVLEREISKDIDAEKIPDRLIAFDSSLPRRDQWKAPHNDTKNLWRSARHVPKDLVTLKTVWDGITNLRSVKEYCRWMIDHPEYRRAPYLLSLGMFDPAVLDARIRFEPQHHDIHAPAINNTIATPAPIEQIRRRLSELADPS